MFIYIFIIIIIIYCICDVREVFSISCCARDNLGYGFHVGLMHVCVCLCLCVCCVQRYIKMWEDGCGVFYFVFLPARKTRINENYTTSKCVYVYIMCTFNIYYMLKNILYYNNSRATPPSSQIS